MSRILTIPDELYTALQEAADAAGTTPLGWIAAHLPTTQGSENLQAIPEEGSKTLADLFAGRVGHIHRGAKERLSEACGETCTDYVEAKRKAGPL